MLGGPLIVFAEERSWMTFCFLAWAPQGHFLFITKRKHSDPCFPCGGLSVVAVLCAGRRLGWGKCRQDARLWTGAGSVAPLSGQVDSVCAQPSQGHGGAATTLLTFSCLHLSQGSPCTGSVPGTQRNDPGFPAWY